MEITLIYPNQLFNDNPSLFNDKKIYLLRHPFFFRPDNYLLNKKKILDIEIEEELVGGACIDAFKIPIKDETIEKARKSDAVLLGAVGGPKWDNLPFDQRPEQGLLRLRSDLQLFANLRPAISFDPLVHASSLKSEIIKGLDILIVRELTGGVYFGEPRGIEDLGNGKRKGLNTQVCLLYTSDAADE